MKTALLFILCFLVLSASTCKKEREDCHYEITIKNNANQDVIAAHKFFANTKCILDGHVISPNGNYKESAKICWENKISNSTPYDLYIVDPVKYNIPNIFYSCDSIEIKNAVLKHYVITLDDLKQSNFIVTYP